MISSKQVLVSGGQFSQYNYNGQISLTNRAPIDILTDAVAPSAFHDSGASFDKPKCHPQTRVKIQEIIMRWIVGDGGDAQAGKQFMWLNGAAGCGKSAIAQSIIESCIKRGVLLASFFFSRSDSTRNHAGSLVATLAYQLFCAFPGTEMQNEILSLIQKDPLIFKKTIQQQFTALVIQPLMTHFSKDRSTQRPAPFLIVIDGLDECADRNGQKAILTGIADSVCNSNLLIFVASRPEHEIKLSFSSKCLEDIHTRISLDLDDGDDADSDIRLYLFDRFAKIKEDFDKRTTGRKLVQDWPGDEVVEMLVWKSSHQFIYAATVIRYVESTRHRPDHRLDVVLNLRPCNGDHPFAELDELYAMILESVLDIEKVLHVLSLYLMNYFPRICCSVIEKMMSYDEGEVETLFCDMGALVRFELDEDHIMGGPVPSFLRILHASLGEYLLDASRSKQFHIERDIVTIKHITYALRYLALCCSSSFDPSSYAGDPIHILANLEQCHTGSPIGQTAYAMLELQQSALSFPLKEFLEPHISSTRTYRRLLEYFVTPFMELLEIIVLDDPTLSYIQDHQLGAFRTVLMQQLQGYFNDDRLAPVLILFYHLGLHRFVPILEPPRPSSYSHSIPVYLFSDNDEGDILSLSYIWEVYTTVEEQWSFPSSKNNYHLYVRQLLRGPGSTVNYTPGPKMHEKAALDCFEELTNTRPLLPSSSGKDCAIVTITDDAEDDTYPKLKFYAVNDAQWRFQYPDASMLDDEELYFLLLGYLIFLLPRCGMSDALVAACEEHRTYIAQPHNLFPVRRRLLHKEINNYLARVLLISPV